MIDVHLLGVHSTGVRQAYLLIQRESKDQESVVIIAGKWHISSRSRNFEHMVGWIKNYPG